MLKIKLLLSYKYLYGYLALSWLNYLVSITLLLKCISKKRNKMEQESFKILQEFIHSIKGSHLINSDIINSVYNLIAEKKS